MDRKKQILKAIENKKLQNFEFKVSDGELVLKLIDELLKKNDFDKSCDLNNNFRFNQNYKRLFYQFETADSWNQLKKQNDKIDKKIKAIEPIKKKIEINFIDKFRELLKNNDLDLFKNFLFTINDHSYKDEGYKEYFLDSYSTIDSEVIELLIQNNKIDFLISLLNKILQNYIICFNKDFNKIIEYFLKNQDKNYYNQFKQFINSWLNNYFSFFIDDVEEAMQDLYDKEIFYKIMKKDSELAADMLNIIIGRVEKNSNLKKYFFEFINHLNIYKVSLEDPLKSYLKQTLQKMIEKFKNKASHSLLLIFSIIHEEKNIDKIFKQIGENNFGNEVIDYICEQYLNPRVNEIEFKERRKIVDYFLIQKLKNNLKIKLLMSLINNQTTITLQKNIFNLSKYVRELYHYMIKEVNRKNIDRSIRKDIKYLLIIIIRLFDNNFDLDDWKTKKIISKHLFQITLDLWDKNDSMFYHIHFSNLELAYQEFNKTGISQKNDYSDGRYDKYNNLIIKDYFTFLIFQRIFNKLSKISESNNNELNKYVELIRKLYSSLLIYTRNVTFINFAVEKKDEALKAATKERDRIMANLSHTIKNMIGTIIDPLENMKSSNELQPVAIDNAIRGANLVRSLVNAMNLSFKGSIEDFKYDIQNVGYNEATSVKQLFLESLKYSISSMFDGKYFNKFMRNYFPNKPIFIEAKNQWNEVSQSTDLNKIESYMNEFMLKSEINIEIAKDFVIGNDKGSSLKLLILIQEMIFNAIKYSSFVSKKSRHLIIKFDANEEYVTIKVTNIFKHDVNVRSTGLGQEIINNFSKLLQTKPIVNTENEIYSVEIKFQNLWEA